jgi:hypothetical protein
VRINGKRLEDVVGFNESGGSARSDQVRLIGEDVGLGSLSLELSAALYYAAFFWLQKQTFCVPPICIKHNKPEEEVAKFHYRFGSSQTLTNKSNLHWLDIARTDRPMYCTG